MTDRISPTRAAVPRDIGHAAVPAPVLVTFVTSSGCHFCGDARALLDDLATQFAIQVDEVELTSAEGMGIARRWRVPFPPVLLVDGKYHAHGRISSKKLVKALTEAVDKGRG